MDGKCGITGMKKKINDSPSTIYVRLYARNYRTKLTRQKQDDVPAGNILISKKEKE